MLRRTLMASAGVMALAGAALAADLPYRAPPPVYLPPPPVFTWTGLYIGINAGGAVGSTTLDSVPLPQPAFGALPFSQRFSSSGFIGGGQIGYNFQTGPYVLGIETDFQGSTIKQTSTLQGLPDGAGVIVPTANNVGSERLDWFGTVRGRVGLTWNSTLIYGTGGLIYGDVKSSSLTTFTPLPQFTYFGSASNVRAGWTVGGGIEYAFNPNWSVKAEGLYFNLGSQNYVAFPLAANPPFNVAHKATLTGGLGRIGLNYKFNLWGPAPVVAKY
jgi:outer membrane immunogenic protein